MMKKTYMYIGTWPILLRGFIPGVPKPENAENVKTGIFGYEMDPKTGDLTPTSNFYTDKMTSELCISQDGKYMYANDEGRDRNGEPSAGGSALSFSVDSADSSLSLISDTTSMGTSPTCVDATPDNAYLFVSNLGNPHQSYAKVICDENGHYKYIKAREKGTVVMYKLSEKGEIGEICHVLGVEGHNEVTFSHYHCVKVDSTGQYLLVCDTNDKIISYKIDYEKEQLQEVSVYHTESNVVPRTITFHPNGKWFYVNNQDNSTVYAMQLDVRTGKIEKLDYQLLVEQEEDAKKTWTSKTCISPDGKYLYVASRSLQGRMPQVKCPPNTIAIVKIDQETGKMALQEVVAVKADNPRGIAIEPNGKFIYLTSMDTNEIYRYRRNPQNGSLAEENVVAKLPFPSSMVFLTNQ